jgi:hypothetical protein
MANELSPIEVGDVVNITRDPMAVWDEISVLQGEIKNLINLTRGEQNPKTKCWTRSPEIRGYAVAIREWRGMIEMKARMLGMYDSTEGDILVGYMKRFGDSIAALLKDNPAAQAAVYKAIELVERK